MKRLSVKFEGRVQQVGFRFFAESVATNFNITGWIKNLDDGDVLLEIQGDERELFNFTNKLVKGNGYSKVTYHEVREIPLVKNEKKFKMIY
ncbi:acylphosphatase [uncultured Clostridium sp.]|uniref:acylphosphatase n=1 Tax=uncultured Clostridium sp. TaxID=59620 RepID=UPI0025CF5C58|nr:acylphosphatase [uncultured Clostridium sp.]